MDNRIKPIRWIINYTCLLVAFVEAYMIETLHMWVWVLPVLLLLGHKKKLDELKINPLVAWWFMYRRIFWLLTALIGFRSITEISRNNTSQDFSLESQFLILLLLSSTFSLVTTIYRWLLRKRAESREAMINGSTHQ